MTAPGSVAVSRITGSGSTSRPRLTVSSSTPPSDTQARAVPLSGTVGASAAERVSHCMSAGRDMPGRGESPSAQLATATTV